MRAWLIGLAGFAALTSATASEPSSGERELGRMLSGKTAGRPQQCLAPGLGSDPQTVSGIGIVYRAGRTDWVSRFEGGCSSLGPYDILVTVAEGNPRCHGQIARVVDGATGVFRGLCTFGPFVPYTRAK